MTGAGRVSGGWRVMVPALAILALTLQLAIPPGFMVAPAHAGGPTIVICTGHGPELALAPGDRGTPAKAPSGKSAPLCPFAGHGGVPTVAGPVAIGAVAFAGYAEPAAEARRTAPGRGLAAPPPPSQAPPTQLA